MIVHVIDGTYELFRHFYGHRRYNEGKDKPFQAVAGVLHSVLEMIETGATHVGVATDHVIESFRNELWPDYKTGEGMEPALHAQFHPLEEALASMGVAVWPMIDLEADDALASAARIAEEDPRVETRHVEDRRAAARGRRCAAVARPDGDVSGVGRAHRGCAASRALHEGRGYAPPWGLTGPAILIVTCGAGKRTPYAPTTVSGVAGSGGRPRRFARYR